MPKKTKKQKILADIHRDISHTFTLNPQPVKSQNTQPTDVALNDKKSTYIFEKKPDTAPQKNNQINDYSYVSHDLLRITVFTLLALISQGVLYFVLNRG